jgi:hypothetical protein
MPRTPPILLPSLRQGIPGGLSSPQEKSMAPSDTTEIAAIKVSIKPGSTWCPPVTCRLSPRGSLPVPSRRFGREVLLSGRIVSSGDRGTQQARPAPGRSAGRPGRGRPDRRVIVPRAGRRARLTPRLLPTITVRTSHSPTRPTGGTATAARCCTTGGATAYAWPIYTGRTLPGHPRSTGYPTRFPPQTTPPEGRLSRSRGTSARTARACTGVPG